ncbi:MAG TPA: redoxin domain-containing protein [Terriglobales bacterium]|nr:redoxin domain-containing protein [Terriglobales bacterium]
MAIKVGDPAPDFTLPAVIGNQKTNITLSGYRGKKNVVIAFYPAAWTPVCGAQMPSYQADQDKFARYDAQVLGISADTIPSHIAWQKKEIGMMDYPLLSDFYPHGEVAKKFSVFREGEPIPGINERAVFVVDKQGKIAFAKVYRLDQQPDNAEVFEALEKLNHSR